VQKRLRDQSARAGTANSKAATNLLTGKLFDENGEPLYATAATGRHGGSYGYYVSRKLVRNGGARDDAAQGWRLAARELEQSVQVSVRAILSDQAAIASTLQEAGAPTDQIDQVLKAARRALLDGVEVSLRVADLVTRLDLRKDGIEISMNLQSLLSRAAIEPAPWSTHTRFVPLQIKRRGFAMRLVIGGEVSTRKIDLTLLRAVARGHRWFNELISGRAAFAREIAARERVNERFIRRHIPLAFLSPTIVAAIVEGRQPLSLTAEALTRGIDIPLEWGQQNAVLGFE
jgi:hypothetical protein